MNHVAHILLSVFLCGLWLPIWILIAISFTPRWHCSICGYSDDVNSLENPELRSNLDARMQEERIRRAEENELWATLTVSEKLSWIASKHQTRILVAGGLTILIVGAFGAAYYFDSQERWKRERSIKEAEKQAAIRNEGVEKRRKFISELNEKNGFQVIALDGAERKLIVSRKDMTPKIAQQFINSLTNKDSLKEFGFESLEFRKDRYFKTIASYDINAGNLK